MALDNNTLIFNLDKTFNLFNLSAKQFDTDNARSFTFQFIQNNTPFSLSDINVKVGGVKPDGKNIFNDVQTVDGTKGIIELDLTSQMLAVNGVLKLEFILMKDNIRLSSYPFEINIVPSVTNFKAIESSDEFGALTNALESVEGTINNLTNKVNEAVTNVTANQIGGTNLLTGTQWFDYGWVLGENGVDAKIDRTNLFQGCAVEVLWYDWNYFYQDINYEVGKTYTISCYAKADKEGANIYFSLADNMTAWGMQKLTTEWKRYVFTFTPTLSTGSLRIECSGVSDNNKAYVSKIKLEKGTMATDWSPSPFDFDHYIDNNTKKIESCITDINNNTKQIESCRTDINTNTKQIASNSSSINDLYSWVNKNIQMEYISGATSLTLNPNTAYYLDQQHVADITSIDHSTLQNGEKVYFFVASGDPLAHIVFRASGLCNPTTGVWLPCGQDFWIIGNKNGDTIYTLMKMNNGMRFLS